MLGGAAELLQAVGLAQGGSQVLSGILQKNSSSKRISGKLQLGRYRHGYFLSRVTSANFPSTSAFAQANLRRRHNSWKYGKQHQRGRVACSESNFTDTWTEAGIEVVQSLEEAENQSLKAVSGDDQGVKKFSGSDADSGQNNDVFGQEELPAKVVQAALEILADGEIANNNQFQSLEPGAIMAAAAKVAEALGEEEHNPGQVYFHMLEPVSPVAAAVMVRDFSETFETSEEAANESERVGFMIQTEAPEHFPAPEPTIPARSVDSEDKLVTDVVSLEEEENLLEPGAVASALMVKEVAGALKAPEDDDKSYLLDRESDFAAPHEVEGKSLIEQLKEIIVFAGPALGIWLSGPIMGIIDTAVIGNSSSLELAALGPGTVLCDQVCYIFMFLSVATSNLIATSLAQKNKEEAAHHLSRMLFLAIAFGLGLLIVTEVWVTELLQAFVGAQNHDLIPAAKVYVQIRALAWPAVLVSLVSQSASLGMMDSKNPLKCLIIGSLFNLVGDVFLCSVLGYGIAGAAWATIASQYVAGIMMALSLSDKGYSALNIQVPSFKELSDIAKLTAPLLLTMISKVSFYTLITYLATSLGAVTVAAHQVMVGIYGLCCVWGEPLAQTAQSFMPPLMYGPNKNLKQARKLLNQLLSIGVVVGTVVGGLAVSIPWICPRIFTSDTAIISQMQGVTVPFIVSMISCPPTLSLEGTLLAGRDFKFLSFSMATCFIGGTALLVACKILSWGLQGSWWTLATFQWARFVMSFIRLKSSNSILSDPIPEEALHAAAA